eukprot:jgi/Mesvir1/3484/Mv11975-RA.1
MARAKVKHGPTKSVGAHLKTKSAAEGHKRAKPSHRKVEKPAWDSTVHDLSKMKLSEPELEQRKIQSISRHRVRISALRSPRIWSPFPHDLPHQGHNKENPRQGGGGEDGKQGANNRDKPSGQGAGGQGAAAAGSGPPGLLAQEERGHQSRADRGRRANNLKVAGRLAADAMPLNYVAVARDLQSGQEFWADLRAQAPHQGEGRVLADIINIDEQVDALVRDKKRELAREKKKEEMGRGRKGGDRDQYEYRGGGRGKGGAANEDDDDEDEDDDVDEDEDEDEGDHSEHGDQGGQGVWGGEGGVKSPGNTTVDFDQELLRWQARQQWLKEKQQREQQQQQEHQQQEQQLLRQEQQQQQQTGGKDAHDRDKMASQGQVGETQPPQAPVDGERPRGAQWEPVVLARRYGEPSNPSHASPPSHPSHPSHPTSSPSKAALHGMHPSYESLHPLDSHANPSEDKSEASQDPPAGSGPLTSVLVPGDEAFSPRASQADVYGWRRTPQVQMHPRDSAGREQDGAGRTPFVAWAEPAGAPAAASASVGVGGPSKASPSPRVFKGSIQITKPPVSMEQENPAGEAGAGTFFRASGSDPDAPPGSEAARIAEVDYLKQALLEARSGQRHLSEEFSAFKQQTAEVISGLQSHMQRLLARLAALGVEGAQPPTSTTRANADPTPSGIAARPATQVSGQGPWVSAAGRVPPAGLSNLPGVQAGGVARTGMPSSNNTSHYINHDYNNGGGEGSVPPPTSVPVASAPQATPSISQGSQLPARMPLPKLWPFNDNLRGTVHTVAPAVTARPIVVRGGGDVGGSGRSSNAGGAAAGGDGFKGADPLVQGGGVTFGQGWGGGAARGGPRQGLGEEGASQLEDISMGGYAAVAAAVGSSAFDTFSSWHPGENPGENGSGARARGGGGGGGGMGVAARETFLSDAGAMFQALDGATMSESRSNLDVSELRGHDATTNYIANDIHLDSNNNNSHNNNSSHMGIPKPGSGGDRRVGPPESAPLPNQQQQQQQQHELPSFSGRAAAAAAYEAAASASRQMFVRTMEDPRVTVRPPLRGVEAAWAAASGGDEHQPRALPHFLSPESKSLTGGPVQSQHPFTTATDQHRHQLHPQQQVPAPQGGYPLHATASHPQTAYPQQPQAYPQPSQAYSQEQPQAYSQQANSSYSRPYQRECGTDPMFSAEAIEAQRRRQVEVPLGAACGQVAGPGGRPTVYRHCPIHVPAVKIQEKVMLSAGQQVTPKLQPSARAGGMSLRAHI